ncbi:MAG TPA: chemotaxis-specific protein-glutamate methyltransferase CheB [Polyangia bacterium]|nr:chemotaxis-specific protein-glutamate methyltransferase CheB [Polyangia bacterium]
MIVADDSAVVRQVVRDVLEADGIVVAAEARDGREAIDLTCRHTPDLVVMDILMPHVDGVQAVARIMDRAPTRVLILSNVARNGDVGLCLDALRAGALDVMPKPVDLTAVTRPDWARDFVERVRLLAGMRLPALSRARVRPPDPVPSPPQPVRAVGELPLRCVAIGASTGGPRVIGQLLRDLPADFPAGLLIVQHIATGFADGLARWLNACSPLEVRVARAGDRVRPGSVLLAPTGQHMVLRHGVVTLLHEAPVHGCRPSVDVLFQSVAHNFRSGALGIILSGMGIDGAEGAAAMKDRGAQILVQAEETCTIFGMPKAVLARCVVDKIVQPDQLARELLRRAHGGRGGAA